MDEPLHPSALSEILDRTAQLYRSRFLVFLGIAVIPTVALLVPLAGVVAFAFWMKAHDGKPEAGIFAGLGLGLVGMISLPIYGGAASLAAAAMNHAGARMVFGQLTSIRDAYRAVWPRGWRYVGLYLMEGIAVWVLPVGAWTLLVMLSAMLAALLTEAGAGGGALFGVLAVVVVAGLLSYGVWMSIRLSLAFPAAIVEQAGAWAAMRRSWTLSKGTRGRIFVLYLLCTALHWILSFAVMIPMFIGISLWPGADNPQNSETVGMVAAFILYGSGFLIQAFTRPVYGIALVLFYYDQRIRQEGFDIEWMMLQAGLVAPAAGLGEAARAEIAPTEMAPSEPSLQDSDGEKIVALADGTESEAPLDANAPPVEGRGAEPEAAAIVEMGEAPEAESAAGAATTTSDLGEGR